MPEGSKKSRLATFKATDPDSSFLQFPDIQDAEYLVSLLHEAGLMTHTGMGVFPLTWQEIESWLRATEMHLSVWEKLTIREMSEAYVSELSSASARDCAAPYVAKFEVELIDRVAVSSKLQNVLRGLKRKT